ncbi:Lysophospholipase L1 [Sphingopyxis sp. YR583]|uniref:GDSL-type esterase/lipase family protein n=1 Tax=Sphingopyxis sp. YR583 TaxID=1881047 RepID=UPI0008A77BEF|nr:GDSL-type esterase/lipase family protein [Sphingopyxis sp. YR583]SEH13832.1 Lysophospholipase L1 [Sphingopyxis sp. YR583]
MIHAMIAFILCGAAAPVAARHVAASAMVAEPCAGLVIAVPDSVRAYFGALAELAQGAARPAPPPELKAYQAANAKARKSDWADLCRYRADNERRSADSARPPRIVFMGDSITELWALADPALFSADIVNRGISGQTSAQMLLRFQADVIALRPAKVHILAGTNDIAGNAGPTSAAQFRDNIRAMVALAKANGIGVILGAIPPAGRFAWKPGIDPAPRIVDLNAWLKAFAQAEEITFVDYHEVISDGSRSIDGRFTFDGVHPNRIGYGEMKRALQRNF